VKTSAFILASLLLVIPCIADIIVIEDDGSGDYPTIQAAIDAASTSDIIEVQPGTYIGNGNRDIDFKGKTITVRSIDPNNPDIVAATIIDCDGTESTPHRGFYFYHNEDANSILAGLTITNGYTRRGGAIYCYYASPTITHCNIMGNTAYYFDASDGGGGIYCLVSPSIITNCRFSDNTAKGAANGGAICGSDTSPSPTISNCVISGNSANRGGGLFNCDGPITDCIIINNLAFCGGGLHSCDGPITNCIISGNSGEWTGGLDWCLGPISNCIITRNSATIYGGAGLGWCHTTITNCIIAGNSSAQWGGGIYGSSATVRNCVIFGNLAGVSGGGICLQDYERMTMTNCIIWNNEAALGAQIALARFAPEISLSYCDVEGGRLAVYDYTGFLLNWGIGNIDDDPCFVDPGYWDPNGTPGDPNDDFWVDGDYHLMSAGWRWHSDVEGWTWDDVTSRCIDAGNPGTPLGGEPITLEVDPLNRFGENIRIDMGAYGGTAEASMPPYDWALWADMTNDGTVDLKDYAALAVDWQRSEDHQSGDLDRDGNVDISDVAVLAEEWLKQTSWAQP
jgi:predicted outer membrane repeat protein